MNALMTPEELDAVASVHEVHCPDCNVAPGEPHMAGCDVERCSVCGWQKLSCHEHEEDRGRPGTHIPESVPWTGEWPGKSECRKLGWWCKPNPDGRGYVPCSPEDLGASEDLNRLMTFRARGVDTHYNTIQNGRTIVKDR